jgi:hypothetical protein
MGSASGSDVCRGARVPLPEPHQSMFQAVHRLSAIGDWHAVRDMAISLGYGW